MPFFRTTFSRIFVQRKSKVVSPSRTSVGMFTVQFNKDNVSSSGKG